MSDLEYFVSPKHDRRDFYEDYKKNWKNFCSDWSPFCGGIKKQKYIEGYTFQDSDDTDNATDRTPLVTRQPADENSANRHIHIITGYVSLFETVLLLTYVGGLVSLTNTPFGNSSAEPCVHHKGYCENRLVLASSCMVHSLLWLVVAVADRLVQWQHQVMRKKGYLKFYRKMKNIRRVPFVTISTGTSLLLIFVALLYLFNISENHYLVDDLRSKHVMYILVGLEMIISISCLIYYIIQATLFNCRQPPPDVIQETSSVSNSPTATLTTVGFRDGEDLDELLERQADMIRYLQQHNASLGRRIMELQSRTIE